MALLAFAPALIGWHCTVVVSGSMTPGIQPGDIVVAKPVAYSTRRRLAPGAVVLVDNPASPGRLLIHRLVEYDKAGQMILKGDANPASDSTPVPIQNLKGVGKLRIPYIGLPYFWVKERRYLPVAAVAVLLLVVMAWRPADSYDGPDEGAPTAPRRAGKRRDARHAA